MPRYQLIGRLESGELAELYKAMRDDGTPVTLKLFHPRTSDAAYAQVLAETARVLNPLAEEGVVHFLDQGMVQGRLGLVREYVDGVTLGVALQRLATKEVLLPPAVALHLVIHLLDVVQRAHDAGLVHGAITPGNVLLGFDGRGYLCDFGALRALQAAPALRAMAGRGRGTYRAPEVGRGEEPTVESDIFSLGAIAYELLSLKELSPGKGMSVRREAIPPPSRLDRRINARIDPIIMRAVELVPARRYRACSEMSHALRNFLSASGGMPNREDVVKFVGELFPNEVRVETLGPVPFDAPFDLEPVSGASLPALPALDEVRPSGIHVRPSFTLEQPVVRHEGLVGQAETRDAHAPAVLPPPEPLPAPFPEPPPPRPAPAPPVRVDPARAATEWEAPAAAAAPSGPRLYRHGRTPASGMQARSRQRAAELPAQVSDTAPDVAPAAFEMPREALSLPVADGPAEPPRPSDRQVLSARSPAIAPLRENVRSDTPVERRAEEETAEPRPVPGGKPLPRLVGIGAAVCLGVLLLVTILLRGSPDGVEEEAGEPAVVDAPDMAPRPIPRPAGAEARPVPARANEEDTGFFSADANVPAQVYVDGTLRGRTPVKRLAVSPGQRAIMLEAVDTGEQKGFAMEFEAGKERKVMEFFDAAPPARRKR